MMNKILMWIIAMLCLLPMAFAQTGLFGNSGASFLTLGVFIIIFFFIINQLRKNIKGE